MFLQFYKQVPRKIPFLFLLWHFSVSCSAVRSCSGYPCHLLLQVSMRRRPACSLFPCSAAAAFTTPQPTSTCPSSLSVPPDGISSTSSPCASSSPMLPPLKPSPGLAFRRCSRATGPHRGLPPALACILVFRCHAATLPSFFCTPPSVPSGEPYLRSDLSIEYAMFQVVRGLVVLWHPCFSLECYNLGRNVARNAVHRSTMAPPRGPWVRSLQRLTSCRGVFLRGCGYSLSGFRHLGGSGVAGTVSPP
jgi:hypothetical protein